MKNKDLELYVHIPFCQKKCNYCDFFSGPGSDDAKKDFVENICKEIEEESGLFADREVTSIFFGGGTPTCLDAPLLCSILEKIKTCFHVSKDGEITLEANPGTVSLEKLEAYYQAGFGRISFGLQSANAQELKLLGRIHSYEDFLESFSLARKAGFTNINVDLMSGIPLQTLESWENTLKSVISLAPEHISAYSLIVEEGTPFYAQYGPGQPLEDQLPEEDVEREMYHQTKKLLSQAGYEQYEISNYAKPGFACKHNIGYWTGVEYMGFGPNAASYVANQRFKRSESLSWREEPIHIEENLTVEDLMAEYMILGLRMNCGVSLSEFQQRFGISMSQVYGGILSKYMEAGLLLWKEDHVFFTERGRDLSNLVLQEFI